MARRGLLRDLLLLAPAAAALVAALSLWRGAAFWSTSDGVYALSARALLDGSDLYGDMAAAQPPGTYVVGAALLAAGDSLTALRAGLSLAPLLVALLVALAVLRLTGRRGLAAGAGLLAPLTPVMLHEHALLTPETLGAPLLLAVSIAAARAGGAPAAGLLAALTLTVKLSFAVPALAVLLAGAAPRRGVAWLAGAGALLAAVATAIWGGALWEGIVVAQGQSGATTPRNLAGLLAQEAWNALPLVAGAAIALALRRRAQDPALLRTLAAAAAGGLVLGLSVVKQGSYVNVVQVAEPPLLALAAGAAAWATGRGARAVLLAAGALLAAQSASLLLDPADPRPATRPLAASGPRRLLAEDAVAAAAARARACPAGAPYPGIPFVAFVAHRPPPGGQPDPFILNAPANRGFAARYVAALARACPRDAPTVDARGDAG